MAEGRFGFSLVRSAQAIAARVRPIIDSTDGHEQCGTVGVSTNMIQMGWHALADGVRYGLLRSRIDKNPGRKQRARAALTSTLVRGQLIQHHNRKFGDARQAAVVRQERLTVRLERSGDLDSVGSPEAISGTQVSCALCNRRNYRKRG